MFLSDILVPQECSYFFSHFTEQLAAIPEFSNLGPLFKSSTTPVELTEQETEYVVRCIKHTFSHYIVFQVGKSNSRKQIFSVVIQTILDDMTKNLFKTCNKFTKFFFFQLTLCYFIAN